MPPWSSSLFHVQTSNVVRRSARPKLFTYYWKVLSIQDWALKMHAKDGEDFFGKIMMKELCERGAQSPRPIIPRQHHHTALYQPLRIPGRMQISSGR